MQCPGNNTSKREMLSKFRKRNYQKMCRKQSGSKEQSKLEKSKPHLIYCTKTKNINVNSKRLAYSEMTRPCKKTWSFFKRGRNIRDRVVVDFQHSEVPNSKFTTKLRQLLGWSLHKCQYNINLKSFNHPMKSPLTLKTFNFLREKE